MTVRFCPVNSCEASRAVSVQQSHGQFTVTPTGDYFVPRAIRGQVRGMRIGKMLSGTRLVESHTGVPKSRQTGESQWASLCLPTPENSKTILLFQR
jgi:hypothetical protein